MDGLLIEFVFIDVVDDVGFLRLVVLFTGLELGRGFFDVLDGVDVKD
jgi:hypothetical protein